MTQSRRLSGSAIALIVGLSAIVLLAFSFAVIGSNDKEKKFFDHDDPDRSPTGVETDFEDLVTRRIEHMDMLRGFDTAQQDSRANAIAEMETAERLHRGRGDQPLTNWVPLGPAPIPVSASTSYSGRVSAIAVHPTNPDIVYVGTAQGGVYRTLNGGTTWTPLMDNALTLAIGAIAIAPSDPTTIFVGTGESSLCGVSCYIGVGLYRITNADTTPVLSDALNKNALNADVFTGRAISEVLVHPTDPNTIFVSTSSGVAGIGSTTTGLALPTRGVYRSTNAMSANPTFELLSLGISERSVTDLVMEPGNPNKIYAGVLGVAAGDGGVYVTSNALATTPIFTQALSTTLTGNNSRVELTAAKVSGVLTVYAASGQGNGTVYSSPDSGPFTQVSNNAFCNPQCFYDIAIAVDPTNATKVYLGGSPTLPFGRSINSGASFANSSTGLHVDTQAIAVAPSNPNIVYFGSDGGIWRTTNVSATPITWTTLNNTTISATQFMGLALHPTDRNYLIGGTQDNGTEFLAPDGLEWIRSDGGDGGFAVIDQTSPDTTNVVAYHTYYNSSGSQIGFARALSTVPPGDPNWLDFLGCGGTANGINCADSVLFYAPMVGGPNATGSTGNTLYFGTNRLYRSIDQGTSMNDVSGTLPARISAIAIAPQNDDVRLIGLTSGLVYLSTTAGATTMTNVTGAITPARYIGRVVIDPTNSNVAYVCLNGFGVAAGQHVWKTTDLLSGTPTWLPAGNGIPDTPVNAFVVDPANTNTLYAGSDIGVFKSTDGGANWTPFSNGLPRVAVFGIAIQATHRVLRIATHGRGIWEYDLTEGATPTPTSTVTSTPTPSQTASISGTVRYGNAVNPPQFISNSVVTGTGIPVVSTTTAAPGANAGQYTLNGFGAGSYTVSLQKDTGINGVTSNDAARIAQHVAGTLPLTTVNQSVSADVTNNGSLSSQDAAKIAQYVAGLPFSPPNLTGVWRFFVTPGLTFPIGASPMTRTYASVTGILTGEDYIGLLGGEVTGNWAPSAAKAEPTSGKQSLSANRVAKPILVALPQVQAGVMKEIVLPVNIQGVAGKGVISYQFDLKYDASVIQPLVDVADLKDTASRGLFVVANATRPGLLRVVVYGAYPIDRNGLLLNLRFKASGSAGSASPLSFENVLFNEGEPRVSTTDGQVTLF